jgi:hypothetical protein
MVHIAYRQSPRPTLPQPPHYTSILRKKKKQRTGRDNVNKLPNWLKMVGTPRGHVATPRIAFWYIWDFGTMFVFT